MSWADRRRQAHCVAARAGSTMRPPMCRRAFRIFSRAEETLFQGTMVAALVLLLSPGCGGDSAGKPTQGCIAWRQTGQCKGDGPAEPCNDKSCSTNIPADSSGYCECADGRHVAFDCQHPALTCEQQCGAAIVSSGQCVSWRQTGQSRADGPREPANDKSCESWIAPDWSGLCECAGKTVPFDSKHPPFACATVCAGIPVATVSCQSGGGGGGGSGGCTADSDCSRCERCERSTGRCISRLSCP
jgi:hypothetical protein